MLPADTDLIPVRALNQVTYCPRLYYLEYEEALLPINEHIEDGLFQHRRVDDPALHHRTRKDGEDQVLFIPLCGRCADGIEALGRSVERHDAKDVGIVM